MEIENDFEVVFEKGVSTLRGHLVDSTEFDSVIDTFSKSKEISFAGLYSVSWLGLQKLYDCFLKLNNPLQLSQIPPHIYRILLLLPGFGKKIGIKSFQVEIFNTKNDRKKISMTLNKLADLGKAQGCFVKLQDGYQIFGSLNHLCRPFFEDPSMPKRNYASKWCLQNEELCSFLYDYACFTRVVLEICSLAQESTSRLIEESLQNICTRISNLEFSVKTIAPHFSDYKSRTLMAMLPHIHDISISVVNGINLSSTTFEAVVNTFEALFQNERVGSKEIFDQMRHFISFSDQLLPIAKGLEDVGVELGGNTLKYGEFTTLLKTFSSFNGASLSEKKMISMRRKLKMDTHIHLTWQETLKDINAEFKYIEQDLNRCIIALQGYDLVRQVLEHRLTEINIFKNFLDSVQNKKMHLNELKQKIILQIVDRLVTDQEKYTYSFFFPNSASVKNDTVVLNSTPVFF
ncbi:MAG: hypothetical protein DCC88_08460 [Spirobacillus cienkowskii]|jgi:hypothetical protein|uniref:Uncharacterized protein n=1 Tax=Spirobacillus cienkowskii TaxID=495820 RepID=A0A369KSI9_9BACT|nr:MAG: hypothetical protein DCC88_08460 [Spirobacillus cienkowskii]